MAKFGPPLYFAVFGVSFVSEEWGIALCLLLALFFALGGASIGRGKTRL